MNCLHIIFSKDRALQLRAQLKSIQKYVTGDVEHVVLYHPSPKHVESYNKVNAEFPEIRFVRQVTFKDSVETLISIANAPYVFFTPDDGLFIRETNIDEMTVPNTIFSMRLGKNVRECHPVGHKPMALPSFTDNDDGSLGFSWDGELDWKYPLALDGHVFNSSFILICMAVLKYRSPTSLEVGLQNFIYHLVGVRGACHEKSHFVSIPWNVVTLEMNNLNAGIGDEVFLEKFNEGLEIKVDHIYGDLPKACHVEYELEFIK